MDPKMLRAQANNFRIFAARTPVQASADFWNKQAADLEAQAEQLEKAAQASAST